MSWGDSPVRALAQAFNTEREWAERLAVMLDRRDAEGPWVAVRDLLADYRAYRTGMDNGRAG